ncbi:flagellar basal-body MS-ring/collar protein FliF [Salirhabdus sp. Marseille-P4669]|uniref:flagellar basal-body MS-ring/collar protein FliF n=1 Tax=Salirhabdus sp. Marseille-P4669 TaxID=2042310 RepID=UPI000C7C7E7E|nr:flagellar basal-body MS-ring/collar protein FliF [Salirhabdus sp. Marseille-P4669]
MVEKMKTKFSKSIQQWKEKSLAKKSIILGSVVGLILIIIVFTMLSTKENMVPLYSNLSLQETGQIKGELDARGVTYSVENGGTTILVPEAEVDSLLVDLAAQGLPNSGNIDYSFFSENASWGMTDGQREMIELDALQTELSNLINSFEGIQNSEVLITLPQESVFVSDQTGEASASIVIHTEPGYKFDQNQINTLYHLVSKSVPNLPTDNIVLSNQYFEYFNENNSNSLTAGNAYTEQQEIKQAVEQDIQQRVQQLLGTMIGRNNVVVSVTTDIDFTQEDRVEELVEPVDIENMEGLPVSVERITETYTGEEPPANVVGTGEEEVTNYPAAENGDGNSEYEMVKESINNEFNRIRKNIVESPYTIRDIGIQVAVDSKKDQLDNAGEVQYLSNEEQSTVSDSISSILNSIITTTVSKEYGDINTEDKVSIVFEEFNEQPMFDSNPKATGIPMWVYIAIGALLLLVILLLFVVMRKKKQNQMEETDYTEIHQKEPINIPEIGDDLEDNEERVKLKQIENMAKEKPEDFAKLLRSWISED